MDISVPFHLYPGEQPADGEVKLVMAWTSPLPMARHFWCFAMFKDGKWTEQNKDQSDLTEVVEYWCDLPTLSEIDEKFPFRT
jgi:hypothetical protein